MLDLQQYLTVIRLSPMMKLLSYHLGTFCLLSVFTGSVQQQGLEVCIVNCLGTLSLCERNTALKVDSKNRCR